MAKTSSDEFAEGIASQVLDCISKHEKDYSDSLKKDEVVSIAKKAAKDELAQNEEVERHNGDVTKLNLPPERLAAIQDGLKMATFRVTISDGVADMKFPDGTLFKPIKLDTKANTDDAYAAQVASIVIEATLLALNIIGVKISVPSTVIVKATNWLVNEYAQSPAFRLAVQTFIKAWKSTTDVQVMAKAIFDLLVAMHKLGLFWPLTKMLISELSLSERLKIAAEVTAMLIAAFASDGIALIAKIALALKKAYEFNKKLENLQSLNELHE